MRRGMLGLRVYGKCCQRCVSGSVAEVMVGKKGFTGGDGKKGRRKAVKKEAEAVGARKLVESYETSTLDRLAYSYKASTRKYTRTQESQTSHVLIMRYSLAGDVLSLVRLAERYLRIFYDGEMEKQLRDENADSTMMAGVCLLSAARLLRLHRSEPSRECSAALAACLEALNSRARRASPEGEAVEGAVLLWDALSEAHDDSSSSALSECCTRLDSLANSVEFVSGSNRLLMTSDDQLRLRAGMLKFGFRIRSQVHHGKADYDKNLRLVDSVREPVESSAYRGNPFRVDGFNEEKLSTLFNSHIESEKSAWLDVKNNFREWSENRKSADDIIRELNWNGALQRGLETSIASSGQRNVCSFISCLPLSTVSASLLSAVVAVLSQGQAFISLSVFHDFLASPILQLVHSSFTRQLSLDENAIIARVFARYSHYFTEDEVARQRTQREWWEECARTQGLPPSFTMPASIVDYGTLKELSHFLLQIVIDNCFFKNSNGKSTAAFTIRNISYDEETLLPYELGDELEGRVKQSKMFAINEELGELLRLHQFEHIVFPTSQLPMTVPPRPWLDRASGGPFYTRSCPSIRNVADVQLELNSEMRKRITSSEQCRPVFDALNCLGSVPWRINQPIWHVLKEVFSRCRDPSQEELLNKLAVPQSANVVSIPNYVETFGEGTQREQIESEKWTKFVKEAKEATKKKNQLNSLWYWMLYRLVLAEHFRDATLYFPHNMDFRGRVYPISPLLNHMGDDINRSLLKFARGKELGAEGLAWLKLHCINLTGTMKRESLEARRVEAEKLLPLMIQSAENPLQENAWWTQSEEPWQTLAACMEVRDALQAPQPERFMSHLPIHQDGSCNGLQHYAALGRDKGGGGEVNLLPSPTPNDVYSSVAARVEARRVADEAAGHEVALKLRVALPESLPRKVIKQTVMTTVYGVTPFGARQQIKRQLKALHISDDVVEFSKYLTEQTFASLSDAFTSSMQLKDWLRACAKGISELMHPVEWTTPLGLPVLQPYLTRTSQQGRLFHKPKQSKQESAFPPNLVHSLDSSHMMLTALLVARHGVTFAAVHDCFWTHAADIPLMSQACRRQFVALHETPLVAEFSRQMKERYLPLLKGNEESLCHYSDLFTPKAQLGELDIKEVMNSEYFFS